MATVARPAPGKRARYLPDRMLPWIGVLGVMLLFEALPRAGLLSSRSFPPMTQILADLGSETVQADFWVALWNTLRGWALGLGVAAAAAVPLGILIGSSRLVYRAAHVLIEFLRPVPSVALIPLAILIYGAGLESKVFLAAFASFWQLLVQTVYGVQDVDPVAMDTARAFGFSRIQRLVKVTLPSSIPYVATGLRIASSVALILAVTAEIVIGSPGLGREISTARAGGNVELMYARIIAIGVLGWTLNGIFLRIERKVLHWHPSYRPTEEVGPAWGI